MSETGTSTVFGVYQVGFDAVKVFKKRNKALKKIHKLIKKGKLKTSEVPKHTN